MAEAITYAVLAFIFGVLCLVEMNFNDRAEKQHAVILNLFTSVHSDDNVYSHEDHKEVAKKAHVQIDQINTDGREGKIVLPPEIWADLEVGDLVEVWVIPRKQNWIFWSPLIRYKKRKLWVMINAGLFSVFVILMIGKGFPYNLPRR